MEPLLRGHPDERPPPLERPLDSENLNMNVLISTSDERPPLLKGHFSCAKGVASQEGFHCISCIYMLDDKVTVEACVVNVNFLQRKPLLCEDVYDIDQSSSPMYLFNMTAFKNTL